MPPQSANTSPGTSALGVNFRPLIDLFAGLNYWYGSNSLPDALEGLPQDNNSNPRMMRRASEAVAQAAGFQRYVNIP